MIVAGFVDQVEIGNLSIEIPKKNGQENQGLLKSVELMIAGLSNASNFAKEIGRGNLNEHFELLDEKDELAGLMLMSLCEGGAVISNSTFSWWGAMLGCGATGVPVAYPAKWIGKENPDLFPPSWIRI